MATRTPERLPTGRELLRGASTSKPPPRGAEPRGGPPEPPTEVPETAGPGAARRTSGVSAPPKEVRTRRTPWKRTPAESATVNAAPAIEAPTAEAAASVAPADHTAASAATADQVAAGSRPPLEKPADPRRRRGARSRGRSAARTPSRSIVAPVVAVEVGIAATIVAASVVGDRLTMIVVLAVGCAVLALVTIPVRGRSVLRWILDRIRLRTRRRRGTRHPAPALGQLLAGRAVHESLGPQGTRAAVLVDETVWASVNALHVSGPGPVGGSGVTRLPIGELWEAIPPSIRGAASLQVVVQRSLVAKGGARWRTWLSLGLDAALCADAVRARGGGQLGVLRSVLVETARVGVRAGLLGLRLEPLDTAGIRATLPELLAIDADHSASLAESWSDCSIGNVVHRSYRQSGWAGTAAMAAALSGDSVAAAQCVTASILLTRDDSGRLTVDPVLRITAQRKQMPAIDARLAKIGDAAGIRWTPLNGSQLAGVRATIPIGSRG